MSNPYEIKFVRTGREDSERDIMVDGVRIGSIMTGAYLRSGGRWIVSLPNKPQFGCDNLKEVERKVRRHISLSRAALPNGGHGQ